MNILNAILSLFNLRAVHKEDWQARLDDTALLRNIVAPCRLFTAYKARLRYGYCHVDVCICITSDIAIPLKRFYVQDHDGDVDYTIACAQELCNLINEQSL